MRKDSTEAGETPSTITLRKETLMVVLQTHRGSWLGSRFEGGGGLPGVLYGLLSSCMS